MRTEIAAQTSISVMSSEVEASLHMFLAAIRDVLDFRSE